MTAQPIKILQVVPRLSPGIDGVGDYALQLAHQLYEHHQILSDFLVFRPSHHTAPRIDHFEVRCLTTHTVAGLIERIPEDIAAVVLQYSNYPYLLGKLDAPIWLSPALRALKQRGLRIVVMFHELPTLRYYCLHCPNPIQRRVSRELAQVADVVVTNNQAFQRTLASWVITPVLCLPNFSTIGEPSQVPPLVDRHRSLIVFGSSDRHRIYRNNLQKLKHLCQQLAIETLFDIGRPVEWDCASLSSLVQVVKTGFLPAAQVSELMLNAWVGISDYRRFPDNLAKSTVYAAYCAHGLVPISYHGSLPPQDGIVSHQHYLDTTALHRLSPQAPNFLPSLQRVASNAHAQYCTHTLATCANTFASFLVTHGQEHLPPS